MRSILEARLVRCGSHTKLVPRIPELRALEGWYDLQLFAEMLNKWESVKTPLSFREWLLAERGYTEQEVAALVIARLTQQNCRVKITCRYSDMFRALSTTKFSLVEVQRYAMDPRVAMLAFLDRAGNIQSCTWFRFT